MSTLTDLAGIFNHVKDKGKGSSADTITEWLPIADVYPKYAIRKDGTLIGFLRIKPVDISLMSDREKERLINSLREVFNGENHPFQILAIPRPVDLETYTASLSQYIKATGNPQRRMILRDSMEYAVRTISSGSCVERQFFIIISQIPGKQAQNDLATRLSEWRSNLGRVGLEATICNDMDIINLFALYAMPQSVAVMSKHREFSIMPVYDKTL